MSYNTDFTRFKSGELAGLDCGSYLKIPRRDRKPTLVARYTGDLEVGQCVAMVRVPAGARIIGADLSWSGTSVSVLSVGDPYACATDILVINNDAESNLSQGGWAGGAIAAKGAGAAGAKWTGGSIVLTIEYLPQS